MASSIKSTRLMIGGMTCNHCQNTIEAKLQSLPGVQHAHVSFRSGTADVTYDSGIIEKPAIVAAITDLNYQVLREDSRPKVQPGRVIVLITLILGAFVLLQRFNVLNLLVPNQLADSTMGFGMLFVIGLITSVHCVAMCGGINISQSLPSPDAAAKRNGVSALRPTILYNLGRVMSYTAIGFILGFAGQQLGSDAQFVLPPLLQGLIKIFAGLFMVVMGINMLSIFPFFRKLQLQLPRGLSKWIIRGSQKSRSALVIGLLNGLMPCGPLQSMQLIALVSGNPLTGALSMFLFSLGTLPLMLGLGALITALGRSFAKKVTEIGAILVVILGLAMISQGNNLASFVPGNYLVAFLILLGIAGAISTLSFRKPATRLLCMGAAFVVGMSLYVGVDLSVAHAKTAATEEVSETAAPETVNGVQIIRSTLSPGQYPDITVQPGSPVQWIIDAPEGSINGCNYKMFIQDYGIEHTFAEGENIITFTPTQVGTISYSCWMGMIDGNITVIQEDGFAAVSDTSSASDGQPYTSTIFGEDTAESATNTDTTAGAGTSDSNNTTDNETTRGTETCALC